MIITVVAAVAIALGTWIDAPTLSPIAAGVAIGLGRPYRAAPTAAVAGLFAWGALLLVAALRGDAVQTLSATLGAALGVPGWLLFVATLLYPAVLAASSAWLASTVSPRRSRPVDPGASLGPSTT